MAADIEHKISRAFHRWGWVGFWIQAPLFILPIVALIYVLSTRVGANGASLRFINYLAFVGLLVMAFTAFWSYRYTRLAKKIADPDARPAWTSVARALWIGIVAAFSGALISLILLIFEVSGLLFLLLKTPQGGVPVMRTAVDERADWVSTINIVALLSELCTLAGEILTLGISLWLLRKLTTLVGTFNKTDKPAEAMQDLA